MAVGIAELVYDRRRAPVIPEAELERPHLVLARIHLTSFPAPNRYGFLSASPLARLIGESDTNYIDINVATRQRWRHIAGRHPPEDQSRGHLHKGRPVHPYASAWGRAEGFGADRLFSGYLVFKVDGVIGAVRGFDLVLFRYCR